MTIEQLKLHCDKLSPAVAYVIGMTLPLYKEKTLGGISYIVGSVNHNPNPGNVILETPNVSLSYVSEAEIGQHFNIVNNFFKFNGLDVKILANRNNVGSISAKNGFSILINKGEKTTDECKSILKECLDVISRSSDEIKCNFIKGCFDGRSSLDWNNNRKIVRYFAVDVDRDHQLQEEINKIANSIKISLNINQRSHDHSKNDQIRIKHDAFLAFEENIGFFSPFRSRQLSYAIKLCR